MSDDPQLTFGQFQVTEYSPTLTLEDSIKRCVALAGVTHDFEFDDLINEDLSSGDLSAFEYESLWLLHTTAYVNTGTWSVTGGRLRGVGDGSSQQFYIAHCATSVEPSYVVSFEKWSVAGGVTVLGNEFVISWDVSSVAISRMDPNTRQVDEVLDTREEVIKNGVQVDICVQYQGMNQFDTIDWVSISVYQEGRCVIGASDFIYNPAFASLPGIYKRSGTEDYDDVIGFATFESYTSEFDNVHVAELHRIREWTSVDPGESVGSGMNRAVGTEPVFYFIRCDGTLVAWIPGDRAVDWAIPTGRGTRNEERQDLMTPGRIRMVGAHYEAESWNETMMEQAGRHLFDLPSDPNLMTYDEAYDGAVRAHRVMREGDDIEAIEIPANPLLEPQDRVTYDGDDLRVMGIQLTISGVGRGRPPIARMSVETQEYIEEGS